jgi:FixJ family two-component response regulator
MQSRSPNWSAWRASWGFRDRPSLVVPMTFLVAVVDDDPHVLESLENLLASAGYGVRLFSSAPSLLDDGDLADFDCLITDIGMPIMDGLELQRVVHGAWPALPIILVTGRDGSDDAIANVDGVHGFFRKPFNAQQLLASVSRAVDTPDRG